VKRCPRGALYADAESSRRNGFVHDFLEGQRVDFGVLPSDVEMLGLALAERAGRRVDDVVKGFAAMRHGRVPMLVPGVRELKPAGGESAEELPFSDDAHLLAAVFIENDVADLELKERNTLLGAVLVNPNRSAGEWVQLILRPRLLLPFHEILPHGWNMPRSTAVVRFVGGIPPLARNIPRLPWCVKSHRKLLIGLYA